MKLYLKGEIKVLAVLDYMFHGSCRRVSKVMSLVLELIGKSTVYELAKKVSGIIAVDETKLNVKKRVVYIWSAVDTKELLVMDTSYQRCKLNALMFLRRVMKMCKNKPIIIVNKGPWYCWALNRLRLEYRHEKFGMRNRAERFFRYLKERTMIFHHKLSARDRMSGLFNLKLFLGLFILYYRALKG